MSRTSIFITRRLISGGLVAALLFLILLGQALGATIYWAVAASHTDFSKASDEAARIGAETGLACSTMEADVKGIRYYRAVAGPFDSKALAEAARDALRSKGWADAWLLSDTIAAQNAPEPSTDADPEAALPFERTIKVGLSWLSGTSFLSGTDGKLMSLWNAS